MTFTLDHAIRIYQMARNPRYQPMETAMSKQLPPDPDGMNNDRSDWANEALEAFRTLTGCERGKETLGDLLCNLHHWCDRNDLDMKEMFERSCRQYRDEVMAPS